MNEIELLKRKIEELERRLDSAEEDRKLEDRGFINTYKPVIDFWTSDVTAANSDTGFRRDLSLSGLAETITIPAYPTRWRKLRDGSDLYIPLYAYNQRYV